MKGMRKIDFYKMIPLDFINKDLCPIIKDIFNLTIKIKIQKKATDNFHQNINK